MFEELPLALSAHSCRGSTPASSNASHCRSVVCRSLALETRMYFTSTFGKLLSGCFRIRPQSDMVFRTDLPDCAGGIKRAQPRVGKHLFAGCFMTRSRKISPPSMPALSTGCRCPTPSGGICLAPLLRGHHIREAQRHGDSRH